MPRPVALGIAGLILLAIGAVAIGLILSRPQPPHFVMVQNSLQTSCTQGDALISKGPRVVYTQNYIGCDVTALVRNEGGVGNAMAVFHALMFHWAYDSIYRVQISPGPEASCLAVIMGIVHGDVTTVSCHLAAEPRKANLFAVPLTGVSVTLVTIP